MRLVFLFFLMLNAGYFIWQSGYFSETVSPSGVESAPPKGVASLTLLRERGLGGSNAPNRPARSPAVPAPEVTFTEPVPPPPKRTAEIPDIAPPPAEQPAPAPASQEPVSLACFTFGPFDKEETVAKAFEAMSAAGGNVKRRQVEQRTPKAYWVYLPPMGSYADALEKVKELRKKGINDLFIMGKGEKQNAVSLGLFSSKATADQRFEEVKTLGMQPVLETQYRITLLEWLDIDVESNRTATIATISAIADEYLSANLSQRNCE